MLRKAAVLGIAFLICGCTDAPPTPKAQVLSNGVEEPILKEEFLKETSSLYLSYKDLRYSVNMTEADAGRLYEEPLNAYAIRELPNSLKAQKELRAAGWAKGNDGFGLILRNDEVVAAVRTQPEKSALDEIEKAAETYIGLFPDIKPIVVDRKTGKYWFFEEGRHRLMICGAKTRKGDWTFTLALGDIAVMDRLRMSKTAAEEDLKISEQDAKG